MRPAAPLLGASLLLALLFALSLATGGGAVRLAEAAAAFLDPGDDLMHMIVRTIRLPRTLIAVGVGAALGLSGALLQIVTRNPLASPGLLGVNAGAALAVVALATLTAAPPAAATALAACIGAFAAGALSHAIAGPAGTLRLILAGAVVTLLASSLAALLLILDMRAMANSRLWLAGSLADRPLALAWVLLPPLAALASLVIAAAPLFAILMLDEATATGLGARVVLVRLGALVLASALAALAVALAGPVSMVGLVAPHLARAFVGPRPGRLLPLAALCGALVLLGADILARIVLAPAEVPAGVLTAAAGAPLFLMILRRHGRERAA